MNLVTEEHICNVLDKMNVPNKLTGYKNIVQLTLEVQKYPDRTFEEICKACNYDSRVISRNIKKSIEDADPVLLRYYLGSYKGVSQKIHHFLFRLNEEVNHVLTAIDVVHIVEDYLKERGI